MVRPTSIAASAAITLKSNVGQPAPVRNFLQRNGFHQLTINGHNPILNSINRLGLNHSPSNLNIPHAPRTCRRSDAELGGREEGRCYGHLQPLDRSARRRHAPDPLPLHDPHRAPPLQECILQGLSHGGSWSLDDCDRIPGPQGHWLHSAECAAFELGDHWLLGAQIII